MSANVPPIIAVPGAPLEAQLPGGSATDDLTRRTATRFVFVDALRGIAALGVACYHITRFGPLAVIAEPVIPSSLQDCFSHGWTGVHIFFVISGFVIAYTFRGVRVTPGYVLNYAFRRSVRLDPPYWCAIAFVLLIHAVMSLHPGLISPLDVPTVMKTPLSWKLLAAHVLYLQKILGYDNLSAAFWTLCIEVQFYLLYAAGYGVAQRFWSRHKRTSADAGHLGLLVVFAPPAMVSLYRWNPVGGNDMWIIHFFCLFFLGMTAWWALDGRVPAWVFWGYTALVVTRLGYDWVVRQSFSVELEVAAAAGVAIYVLGRAGRLGSTFGAAWLQYLGRISYSLYLIHFPVSHVVTTSGYTLFGGAMSPAAAALWLVLALLASIAAAHVLYTIVEAPCARFASGFKASARIAPPADKQPGR